MKDSIRLSEKHGVNPSVETCFVCGNDTGVILFGKLPDDKKAPRSVCIGHICDECTETMKVGVFLIEVDLAKTTDKKNPWRTGRLSAIRDEAFRRIFGENSPALKKRLAFVENELYSKLIPDEIHEKSNE